MLSPGPRQTTDCGDGLGTAKGKVKAVSVYLDRGISMQLTSQATILVLLGDQNQMPEFVPSQAVLFKNTTNHPNLVTTSLARPTHLQLQYALLYPTQNGYLAWWRFWTNLNICSLAQDA